MHTVAWPDRIVHHSALNMKMKTFWSLNLDFHSDAVCNLLLSTSKFNFVYPYLNLVFMLHAGKSSNFIWPSWNHVYEFDSISYYTSSLIIAESCFLFILSSFGFLKLPCVCQVLWSDQQPGGDHCDPVRGPGVGGDGEARGPGAGQGQPAQVHNRQQDLLLCHW